MSEVFAIRILEVGRWDWEESRSIILAFSQLTILVFM